MLFENRSNSSKNRKVVRIEEFFGKIEMKEVQLLNNRSFGKY
jgi:hypothetical protein